MAMLPKSLKGIFTTRAPGVLAVATVFVSALRAGHNGLILTVYAFNSRSYPAPLLVSKDINGDFLHDHFP
jgi:hypothetical protein